MAITARRLRRLEAWSNWRAAGGTRLAVVDDAISVHASAAIDNEQLVVTLPLDSPAIGSLGARRILTVDQSDAVTNLAIRTDDFANAIWQKRGTGTVTPHAAIAPNGRLEATLLSGIGVAGNDVFQNIAGLTVGARYEPSFWLKLPAPINDGIQFTNPATTAVGNWQIDLNKVATGWNWITRNHPAVSIVTEFTAHTSGVSGLFWRSLSGNPISFYVWGPMLEPGTVSHDYVPAVAAPVTVPAIFDEYRIIDRAVDDEQGVWAITAQPFRLTDLHGAGLVSRKDSDNVIVYDFEVLGQTPTEIITNWVLPALAAGGFGWIGIGTITPTARLDMTFAWDTPLGILLRLASATQSEIDLRRNGTSGYLIDIVTKINSAAQQADLRVDKNLVNVTRSESSIDQATRVYPKGSTEDEFAATMARAKWAVQSTAGPIITLKDPAGGKGPIQFDNQLVGMYFREHDGTMRQVLSSSAAGQTVTLASTPISLTVDDLVEFRADVAGSDLTYLDDPAAVTVYGIKSAIADIADVPATDNLVKNPAMRLWPGSSSLPPTNWTAVNGPAIAKQTAAPFTAIGGQSIKVVSTTDGQGVISDAVPIFPTALNAYLSGYAKLWVASGNARVELVITTPSGTKVFPLLPDVATPTVLGQWADIGASGFDANGVAATAAQIRIVQHGTAASVFYIDAAQITQTSSQRAFFEGSGGTRLWQEANEALRSGSNPVVSFTVPLVDLEAYDPQTWSESALILGANARVADPRLGIDIVTRIVGIERDYLNPQATSVTLSNRFDDLTDILADTIRPERNPGLAEEPLTIPQQPKLSANFDINGQLIINSFGDNDVASQKIAWATGSAPTAATVRAATAINQQNISGLATGSSYLQGVTVYVAAFAYNARGFESSPLAVGSFSRQGAIIDYTPFASSLEPILIVSSLPGTGAFLGQVVFLTTDKKLYRWDGSAWTAAVPTVDLTGQIQTAQIANLAVTSAQIGANAVIAGKIAADAVGSAEIAALAVTAAEIANSTITTTQIAAAAGILGAQIASATIGAGNIVADTITASQIAANAITSSELAANAVVAGKIAALTIVAGDIAASTITGAKIAATTITAANIASHTITAAEITALTITAAEIAAGTITGAKIAANTITAGNITAATITATEIAALTITGAKIAAGTITADKLVANSITAGQIQAGAISTTELAAGAVTAAKIAAGTITADKIVANSLTSAQTLGRSRGITYRGSTAQSISNATATQVTWENSTNVVDSGGQDLSHGYTIQTGQDDGTWGFNAQVSFNGNITGDRSVEIRRNGTTVAYSFVRACAGSGNATVLNIWYMEMLAFVGDFYEVVVWQNSGGSLNVISGIGNTYFRWIHLW